MDFECGKIIDFMKICSELEKSKFTFLRACELLD